MSCKSSQRQFLLAVHLYGDENQQRLPSGAPNLPLPPDDDHLPILSATTSNSLVLYLSNQRMVYCPSFADYFKNQAPFEAEARSYGYVIGYNYNGGHTNTPWPALSGSSATWISPQRLTDRSSLVLISDMNDWSPGDSKTFAPHARNGPILSGADASNEGARGASSAALGALGGNLGLLDGSVSWKRIGQMQIYRASQQWGDNGCVPCGEPSSQAQTSLMATPYLPRAVQVLGALLTLCMRLAATDGPGEDWPRFLGPNGNNTSTETGLLDKWPAKGLPLVWEKQIGAGYSAPSVRHPYLVLHHRLKEQEIVEALEAASGNPLWRYTYASSFIDPFGYNNGPRCTPLLTSNRCYTFGADGKLVCLALQTGQLIWQRETSKEWNVPEPFFGVGSTPLLEGDRLILMIGGQPNSGVVALDAGTGKTLWENVGKTNWDGVRAIGWRGEPTYRWTGEEKLASYSSPVAATIHGRRHILCLTRQGLVSLNPTNGEIYFSRWFQSPVNESVNAMCPVVSEDLVLLSGAYYRIGSVLLRIKPDGRSCEEVWRSPRQPLEREPGTGSLISPVLEAHWNTPVLHDGYLYAFSGRNEPDATFRCVEFKSGQLMWSRDELWRSHSSPQPSVYGRGSAILADGKLLVLGEGGKLGLFALNPKQPEETCSWQVPQLHYPCWAAPVLSRKKLYLRSEDRLLCFELSRGL